MDQTMRTFCRDAAYEDVAQEDVRVAIINWVLEILGRLEVDLSLLKHAVGV